MTIFRSLSAFGLILALSVAVGTPADASAFSVTDSTDDVLVPNTLRWAIAQANADVTPPTIDLSGGMVIDLTCAGGGALQYDNAAGHALTINANGSTIRQTCAGEAVIDAFDDDLVVNTATITGGTAGGIVGGEDVTVNDTTIEDNSGGPGIETFTGDTTVVRSSVRNNDSGGIGGGVAGIDVFVERSTINSNTATTGAGVWSDQTATITNSTITGNTATGAGGGVLTTNNGLTLTYSTIVDNTASSGANLAMLTAGNLTSFASIVALPAGATNCALNAGVGAVSQGSNFVSDASCALEVSAGDPMLGGLGGNGGPTATRLPAAGSPAIDGANCAGSPIAIDQRAIVRPQGPACDIGAVEVVPTPAPTTTTSVPETTTTAPTATAPLGPSGPTLPRTGSSAQGLTIAATAILAAGLIVLRCTAPRRAARRLRG